MKKNYLKELITLCIVILFIAGCQKETKEINYANSIQSKEDRDDHKNGCRLVFGTNADPTGSADFTFHYNDKGLASEWDIENYGTHVQEYDVRGKLKKSTLTQNGEVTATVSFFYNGGEKVAKEIWHVGTSTDTSDIIYYHYNAQGNLVKTQSFINDYIATGKYTPEGNLSETDLYFSGVPVYSAIYTYTKHFKNPYLAVPGIDHLFPYYTPMDLFYGKWRWASLKQLAYDESGNPMVVFDYDPSKTIWQAGPHNYPASVNYFDLLSGGWFPYPFQFENCGDDRGNDYNNTQTAVSPTAPGAGKINPMMLLRRNPAKSMKEQVKEFRQQLKNIKNSSINN